MLPCRPLIKGKDMDMWLPYRKYIVPKFLQAHADSERIDSSGVVGIDSHYYSSMFKTSYNQHGLVAQR